MAFNWQDALSGATGGALSGAGTGALFGGVGAPIGAGLGGILGLLASVLSGGGQQGGMKQLSTITPQQNNILDMLLQVGSQNLQNPYQGFEPIRQSALNTFYQDIVPHLQEQFTGAGGRGSNAYSSPLIQSQLSGAGSSLSQRLAAMQSQFGQQNQQNALRQLGLGLTPQFQPYYQQRQPGFGENLLTGAIGAAPAALQAYQQNKLLDKLTGK